MPKRSLVLFTTMSNVVKSFELSKLFCDLNSIIRSDTVNNLCRKNSRDFTRNRNMNFYRIIYYFIFRNRTTTNAELTHFYSSIDQFEKRISKQALNKAIKKLNPNVFAYLINQFASIYYATSLPKKHRDYLLIAEDGTYMEIPYNIYNINDFQFCLGRHVHDILDVKKIQSKAGGLYDITNGLFIDFSLRPAPYSETPLAFAHLYRTKRILENHKVIYLADRYYGSAEIISHLEFLGYRYIIRGKSNFYKKQIACMHSDDEWIEVDIDDKWLKRFRFSSNARRCRAEDPVMRIRVIKKEYKYTDGKNKEHCENLIYFTNLDDKEFVSEDVMELYSKRWDIEVSYKTMKTTQEIERHISSDGDVARNDIYAKVMFHNIAGVLRKEMNHELKKRKTSKEYVVNITQLHAIIHETNFLNFMMHGLKEKIEERIDNIIKLLNKIKVPVRPNRHYQRWGRVMTTPPSYRFRIDGRNNPKVIRFRSVLMTKSP